MVKDFLFTCSLDSTKVTLYLIKQGLGGVQGQVEGSSLTPCANLRTPVLAFLDFMDLGPIKHSKLMILDF